MIHLFKIVEPEPEIKPVKQELIWRHKLKLIPYLPVIDDIQFMIKSLLFNLQANQLITPPEEAVFKNGKFTDSQGIVYQTYGGPKLRFRRGCS